MIALCRCLDMSRRIVRNGFNLQLQARFSNRPSPYSTKKRKGMSSEHQFFALLSYASIDHYAARTLSKTKNCELCGSDFECKGLLGCWCRSMDTSREELGELSKRTSDCICPNCLAGYKERVTFLNLFVKPYYSAPLNRLNLNFAMTRKELLLQWNLDRL